MADDDALKKLEARLTRLEATLAQQPSGTGTGGVTPPGGAVVDPAPWPPGGWGGWGPYRWPHPITDPAAFAAGVRWPHPIISDPAVFAAGARWPHPIVDPAAFASGPWGHPWPTPIVDPAVFAGGAQSQAAAATTLARIGQVGDPPPVDVSRFTIPQLEATLHSINAEKARLASMETMVTQQLDKLKKQVPAQG
jgi:hypothetical protein